MLCYVMSCHVMLYYNMLYYMHRSFSLHARRLLSITASFVISTTFACLHSISFLAHLAMPAGLPASKQHLQLPAAYLLGLLCHDRERKRRTEREERKYRKEGHPGGERSPEGGAGGLRSANSAARRGSRGPRAHAPRARRAIVGCAMAGVSFSMLSLG